MYNFGEVKADLSHVDCLITVLDSLFLSADMWEQDCRQREDFRNLL